MAHDEAYLLAAKKIEDARRWKAMELNLSGMGFSELPKSLGQLTKLRSLQLSFNLLTTLPNPIGNLTKLQSLDLTRNRLAVIPDLLGQLTKLQSLNLSFNQLTILPDSLGQLTELQSLDLSGNHLKTLPESLSNLTQLQSLNLSGNQLTVLPKWLGQLSRLQSFFLIFTQLETVPESLSLLTHLQELDLSKNQLTELPVFFVQFEHLRRLNLDENPLNPELAASYKQGLQAVKAYLRAKANSITLNEAKLILVGEGEVGKTCLMDALLDNAWQEHPSTHGIQIKQVKVTDTETHKEITLNGWDFGGQRVYRPTHQLFFSAPAVYLVVWKPREGPQQGFVKEWIQLIKRREPSARIIVVATHGGPQQRQPDIDRQELWDTFGVETVVDFFFVDSKPDENGKRKGIEELKGAIARVAATLPEVGRSVPKSFADVRAALQAKGVPYLPLDEVITICRAHNMDDEIARLFITISHRLGHLTHYEYDPALRDIVILRPDWLATAMSYVLDDEQTRTAHGLVKFSRLGQLWDDKTRAADSRYPATLHPIFLRLMERFDLSYRVADPASKDDSDPLSLIGQLVPDNRPENMQNAWLGSPSKGDLQQTQICRIVDAGNGQSASAEGLFYQLIVRLHKYSLGRVDYANSVHWQRGLVLDDDYNGCALLEHVGNDVRITVRAPYPQGLLTMLTAEVKYLVESFWEGLRCDIMVPCLNPNPCKGLLEVGKLIENKKRNRPEQPCPICNEWQNIDNLLLNAPAAQSVSIDVVYAEFTKVKDELFSIRPVLAQQHEETLGRFSKVDTGIQRLFSQAENNLTILLQVLSDEAKEGPRIFSLAPVTSDSFDPRNWATARFRLTLYCEHSHLPLTVLNQNNKIGVYEFNLTRKWVKDAAPFLKAFTITLRTLLPVAFSAIEVFTDHSIYQAVEKELDFSKECIDALIGGSEGIGQLFVEETSDREPLGLESQKVTGSHGAKLREFHALLNKVDPKKNYGNLVRVMNKRQEFLWVHERFAGEY